MFGLTAKCSQDLMFGLTAKCSQDVLWFFCLQNSASTEKIQDLSVWMFNPSKIAQRYKRIETWFLELHIILKVHVSPSKLYMYGR